MDTTGRRIIFDTIIVGAGAAGLMCALQSRLHPRSILILDAKPKIGAKILMSGGTRCNVTNKSVTKGDYQSEKLNLAARVLAAYSSEKAVEFFKSLGVHLVEETGGKLFPVTHSGRTILDALTRALTQKEIEIAAGRKATRAVRAPDGLFLIGGDGFEFKTRSLVLCTGGLSYPATGSDGAGYSIAKSFGHTMIETSPSLTPLVSNDGLWHKLSGLALPSRLSFWLDGKKTAVYEGPLLFTHFGYSGPAVLNISRHWIRAGSREKKITVNFVYEKGEEAFRAQLDYAKAGSPKKQLRTWLMDYFPVRFVEVLFMKTKIPEDRILADLKKEERETCLAALGRLDLPVTSCLGYQKAEVTAGGIPLDEIDTATMESRLVPGLFFAGEILDVDGRIGGFNFQWAWASGYQAARGVSAKLMTSGNLSDPSIPDFSHPSSNENPGS